MRVRLTGFVLAGPVVGSASALAAADRPPQDLHLVGDHWTAWNPPELRRPTRPGPRRRQGGHALGPGRASTTAIPTSGRRSGRRTSTSWTPTGSTPAIRWCWASSVAPADNLAQTGAGGGAGSRTPGRRRPSRAPPARMTPTAAAAGTPVPLGAESDIYCQGYVGDLDEQFPYAIVGSEYDALSLDNYVRGATGWKVGTLRQRHEHHQVRPHGGRHHLRRRRPGAGPPARHACSRRSCPISRWCIRSSARWSAATTATSAASASSRCRRTPPSPRSCSPAIRSWSAPCSSPSSPSRCRSAAAPPCGRSTSPPRPRSSRNAPVDRLLPGRRPRPRRRPRRPHRPRRAGRDAGRHLHHLPREPARPAADRHGRARRALRPQALLGREDHRVAVPDPARRPPRSEVAARARHRRLRSPGACGKLSASAHSPEETALGRTESQWTPVSDRRRARPPGRDAGAGPAGVRAAIHRRLPEVQPGQLLPFRPLARRSPQHPPQQGLRPRHRGRRITTCPAAGSPAARGDRSTAPPSPNSDLLTAPTRGATGPSIWHRSRK